MTDDPKEPTELEPGDVVEPVEVAPVVDTTGEAGGEAAGDLNASELEAAASAAEVDVESDGALDGGTGLATDVDAEADATTDGDAGEGPLEEDAETVIEAAPQLAPGTGALERRGVPGHRTPRGPKPARTVFAVDPAMRIRDQASAIFVLVTVGIFVLILANAMLLGKGGALTPLATPTPIPTAAPSVVPSGSVGPSGSVSPSGSAAPSASPVAVPSAGASPGAS